MTLGTAYPTIFRDDFEVLAHRHGFIPGIAADEFAANIAFAKSGNSRALVLQRSGNVIDLLHPASEMFDIEDLIAGQVSTMRWGGATSGEFPVTEALHGVLSLEILRATAPGNGLSPSLQLATLTHGASKGVLGFDCLRAVKPLLGAGYRRIDEALQQGVNVRLGLPARLPREWTNKIQAVSRLAVSSEAHHLTPWSAAQIRKSLGLRTAPLMTDPLAFRYGREPWSSWSPDDIRDVFSAELSRLMRVVQLERRVDTSPSSPAVSPLPPDFADAFAALCAHYGLDVENTAAELAADYAFERARDTDALVLQQSGRVLNLIAPSAMDLELEDVARGQADVIRWGGASITRDPVRDAQHTLLVTAIVEAQSPEPPPPALLLASAIHDTPEGPVKFDCITPLKPFMGRAYKRIDAGLEAAHHLRFGLPAILPADWTARIKSGDRLAAVSEAHHMTPWSAEQIREHLGLTASPLEKDPLAERYGVEPWRPWPRQQAMEIFQGELSRLSDLVTGRTAEVTTGPSVSVTEAPATVFEALVEENEMAVVGKLRDAFSSGEWFMTPTSLPEAIPGPGQISNTDDAAFIGLSGGLMAVNMAGNAPARGSIAGSLFPLAQRLMPLETASGRLLFQDYLIDKNGEFYDGATIPFKSGAGEAGAIGFAAAISLAGPNPANTVGHEAAHNLIREGKMTYEELAGFSVRGLAERLTARYGLDRYPEHRRLEEGIAWLTGEWVAGPASGDGAFTLADALSETDEAADARRETLAAALDLDPRAVHFLDGVLSGEVGLRPSVEAIRTAALAEMGVRDWGLSHLIGPLPHIEAMFKRDRHDTSTSDMWSLFAPPPVREVRAEIPSPPVPPAPEAKPFTPAPETSHENGNTETTPYHAVAARFGIPVAAVMDLVDTDLHTLRQRDEYSPPNNTLTPTLDYERLPLGSVKIWKYGDADNSYVDYLRSFDPNTLVMSEPEDGIKTRSPSYPLYVQWFKDGHMPPPILVADSASGDGLLVSSNRRRVLAAQAAGVPAIIGWFSPNNAETGLPLKFGDVRAAYAEAVQHQATQDAAVPPLSETVTPDVASPPSGLFTAEAAPVPTGAPSPVDAVHTDAAIADLPAVVTSEQIVDAPEDWLVMNAPRPLIGHRTVSNSDTFLRGRHYAAIDPTDEVAAGYIRENTALGAAVVLRLPAETINAMADQLVPERYRDRYEAMGPERRDQIRADYRARLSGKPYRELRELLARTQEQRSVAAKPTVDTAATASVPGGAVPEVQETITTAAADNPPIQTGTFPEVQHPLSTGTRVILGDGRHGAIQDVHAVTMTDIFGGSRSTTYSYVIKTDAGAEQYASATGLGHRLEDEPAPEVIPDLLIGREYVTPENFQHRIGLSRRQADDHDKRAATRRNKDYAAADRQHAAEARDRADAMDRQLSAWVVTHWPMSRDRLGLTDDHLAVHRYRQQRSKTAAEETALRVAERRASADPSKWLVGHGVGRRVTSDQINRGFRIAAVDGRRAQLVQVADTGLTSTGGNSDRIEPQWVHIGDLLRDRRYDVPEISSTASPNNADAAEDATEDFGGHAVPAAIDAMILHTKHSQKGYALHVVALADRVERGVYDSLLAEAKSRGGWYSRYRGQGAIPGFQFKDHGKAREFAALVRDRLPEHYRDLENGSPDVTPEAVSRETGMAPAPAPAQVAEEQRSLSPIVAETSPTAGSDERASEQNAFSAAALTDTSERIPPVRISFGLNEGGYEATVLEAADYPEGLYAAANRVLAEWAAEAPTSGAYDKTDFTIHFKDGEGYSGRLDLKGPGWDDRDMDLSDHVRSFIDFSTGRVEAPWMPTGRQAELIAGPLGDTSGGHARLRERYALHDDEIGRPIGFDSVVPNRVAVTLEKAKNAPESLSREEAVRMLQWAIQRESRGNPGASLPLMGPQQGFVGVQRFRASNITVRGPGELVAGWTDPRPLPSAAVDFLAEHYGTPIPSVLASVVEEQRIEVAAPGVGGGNLPEGWTEARPGGLASNPEAAKGGIIDRQEVGGKWFVVFNRDDLPVQEGFASREDAFAAFEATIAQAEKPRWAMTRDEHYAFSLALLKARRGGRPLFTDMGDDSEIGFQQKANIAHREHVEKALQEGLDVPQAVRDEYEITQNASTPSPDPAQPEDDHVNWVMERQRRQQQILQLMAERHGWRVSSDVLSAQRRFAGVSYPGDMVPDGGRYLVLNFRGPVARVVMGINADWSDNVIATEMVADSEPVDRLADALNAMAEKGVARVREKLGAEGVRFADQSPEASVSQPKADDSVPLKEELENKPRLVGLTMDAIAKRLGFGGWTSALTEEQKVEIEQVFDSQAMGPVQYSDELVTLAGEQRSALHAAREASYAMTGAQLREVAGLPPSNGLATFTTAKRDVAAMRWLAGRIESAVTALPDARFSALAISRSTTKADMDRQLVALHGMDEVQAREASNRAWEDEHEYIDPEDRAQWIDGEPPQASGYQHYIQRIRSGLAEHGVTLNDDLSVELVSNALQEEYNEALPSDAVGRPTANAEPAPNAATDIAQPVTPASIAPSQDTLDLFSARSSASPSPASPTPAGNAAPAMAARSGTSEATSPAESTAPAADPSSPNFTITSQADLAPAGQTAKVQANLEAVRLVKQLQTEARPATPEEHAVLARFSGWGHSPQIFDEEKGGNWATWRQELRELLNESEYAAAALTTVNAHYTSHEVTSSMWQALQNLGFQGGDALEPGCGTGNFIGTMPEDLAPKTTIVGEELDPTTAAVAAKLYPNAEIRAGGFEKTSLPDNNFDMVIGNVPFGQITLHDPRHNKGGHTIHNHFIVKSLALAKPGAVMALVTSRFTLDSRNPSARREMADQADLLGAIRLPETAFKANAGTEVVTDILFFRKRLPGEEPLDQNWINTTRLPTPLSVSSAPAEGGQQAAEAAPSDIFVNNYFHDNPGQVLGTYQLGQGMYSAQTLTVLPRDGASLAAEIATAAANVVDHAKSADRLWAADRAPSLSPTAPIHRELASDTVKEGAFFLSPDGSIMRKRFGYAEPVELRPADREEVGLLIALRDSAHDVLNMQGRYDDDELDEHGKHPWTDAQGRLNELYDTYVATYGAVSRFTAINRGQDEDGEDIVSRRYPKLGGFRTDPDFATVLGLENFDDETQKATKATIFSARVLNAPRQIRGAEDASGALMAVLESDGKVNLPRMAELLGTDEQTVVAELKGAIYRNPARGAWETADHYLSGNVRVKLREAMAAAESDASLVGNVEALTKVQPRDLTKEDIKARLGAPFIPDRDVQAFANELFETDNILVNFSPLVGGWLVNGPSSVSRSELSRRVIGTTRRDGLSLLDDALNGRPTVVYDEWVDASGSKHRVKNPKATMDACERRQAIEAKFQKWIWQDRARATRLVEHYNETYNATVLRTFDGGHLKFPGLATNLVPHGHQKNVAWRVVQDGNCLMAHCVGAGKTLGSIIASQEEKRLGLTRKPAFAVPNHMLEQFAREFKQAYPNAKLLLADTESVSPENRKEFVARCAMNEWDAVIFTHSSFGKIPVSGEAQQRMIERRIDELRAALDEARQDKENGRSPTVKQLQRALKNAQEKARARMAAENKDDGLTFEQLGIDKVYIDEMHLFKNLFFVTRRPGVSPSASQRAEDLLMKVQMLEERSPGRAVVGMTGTPIANRIAEMFVVQTYFDRDSLAAKGIDNFDSWAGTFGEDVTAVELAPDGVSWRLATRFARYVNVPELLTMFRRFADVQTADMLNLNVPKMKGGKPEVVAIPPSELQEAYIEEIKDRIDKIKQGVVAPTEDNMLKVTMDGRKAAADMRMLGFESKQEASKADVIGKKVAEIYGRTKDWQYRQPDGTLSPNPGALQVVFCDLGTPKDDGSFSMYDAIAESAIAGGVPANRIRYVQDYPTDEAKAALFADCRNGKVSLLIGSTEKMGVGTNIQTRLFATHHADCPWRPVDIEQRDGRMIRQGNQHYDLDIAVENYVYGTSGTFDIFMWQTAERKAEFISQIMRGDITTREIAEIGGAALSYAEAKAILTGNPILMEKAGIDGDVVRLSQAKRRHEDAQQEMAQTISVNEHTIPIQERRLAALVKIAPAIIKTDREAPAVRSIPLEMRGFEPDKVKIKISKVDLEEAEKRGKPISTDPAALINSSYHYIAVIRAAAKALKDQLDATYAQAGVDGQACVKEVGAFAGLPMRIHAGGTLDKGTVRVALADGEAIHFDVDIERLGNGKGPEYLLYDMMKKADWVDGDIDALKNSIAEKKLAISQAKAHVGAPFDKQAELDEKLARQAEINAQLADDAVAHELDSAPATDDVEIDMEGHTGAVAAPGGSQEAETPTAYDERTDFDARDKVSYKRGIERVEKDIPGSYFAATSFLRELSKAADAGNRARALGMVHGLLERGDGHMTKLVDEMAMTGYRNSTDSTKARDIVAGVMALKGIGTAYVPSSVRDDAVWKEWTDTYHAEMALIVSLVDRADPQAQGQDASEEEQGRDVRPKHDASAYNYSLYREPNRLAAMLQATERVPANLVGGKAPAEMRQVVVQLAQASVEHAADEYLRLKENTWNQHRLNEVYVQSGDEKRAIMDALPPAHRPVFEAGVTALAATNARNREQFRNKSAYPDIEPIAPEGQGVIDMLKVKISEMDNPAIRVRLTVDQDRATSAAPEPHELQTATVQRTYQSDYDYSM